VAGNLLVLGLFKYALFFLDSVAAALGHVGVRAGTPAVNIVLPLGISFFTFEFIHYLVDVHRGHLPVRAPLAFAAFATFFPTQIAGPIKRFEDFMPQLERAALPDRAMVGQGMEWIVAGLFKKVALADNLAPIVQRGFGPGGTGLGQADAWLTMLAFAFQIYFDFSGYTDIGRGAAMLLGFRVPENFLRPYLACNISDFWRRWHISLSSWLRDYLYIPLGGNRRHQARNLALTMLLGGLWHGANWTFVIWGAWHGLLLVLYWRIRGRWRSRLAPLGPRWQLPAAAAARALTLALVTIGWVFFRAASIPQALNFLRAMCIPHGSAGATLLPGERLFVTALVAGWMTIAAVSERAARTAAPGSAVLSRLAVWYGPLKPAALVLLLALTMIAKPGAEPRFLYFQF
jgi:alginate O-acetyltransferase complex protein AlgI